jgi:lysozyme family protein
MAEFETAFDITMGHEGGYSKDPDDVGGETYRGISRVYHPEWDGWAVIDEAKSEPNFPSSLKENEDLEIEVRHFYKLYYWDVNRLDEVGDQDIANEMFDTGVNLGIGRAAKYLQAALNFMNRNGQIYEDLVEDGKIGPASLNALKKYLVLDDPIYIIKIMNILQGNHYLEYMRQSPTQDKYARGWLKRVDW